MVIILKATNITLEFANRLNKLFQLSCCGLNTASDWGGSLPTSCCAGGPATCTTFSAFSIGCNQGLKDFIGTSGNIIGAVALGVAGIEVCDSGA